jgi:hypothetical protein
VGSPTTTLTPNMIAAPGTVEYSNPSGPKMNPRTAARAGSLEEPTTTTWAGAE